MKPRLVVLLCVLFFRLIGCVALQCGLCFRGDIFGGHLDLVRAFLRRNGDFVRRLFRFHSHFLCAFLNSSSQDLGIPLGSRPGRFDMF